MLNDSTYSQKAFSDPRKPRPLYPSPTYASCIKCTGPLYPTKKSGAGLRGFRKCGDPGPPLGPGQGHPEATQAGPRAPKSHPRPPRTSQEPPRSREESPRGRQEGPRSPPEAPRSPPKPAKTMENLWFYEVS